MVKVGRINKLVRGVRVTVKFQNFRMTDKSTMLSVATNCPETIFKMACDLLLKVKMEEKVRLIGLSVKDFTDKIEVKPERKPIVELFSEKNQTISTSARESKMEPVKVEITESKPPEKMAVENLEKELDDLEALWFEKLDANEDSRVLSNTTNQQHISPEVIAVANPELVNFYLDNPNPFSRAELSKKPRDQSNANSGPSSKLKLSMSKKITRVLTIEEQFRNTMAAGSTIVSKEFSDNSEPITPTTKMPEMMVCPICNKNVSTYGFLSRFNKHIDECLLPKKSRSTVGISEDSDKKEPKKAATKGLIGFFGSKK